MIRNYELKKCVQRKCNESTERSVKKWFSGMLLKALQMLSNVVVQGGTVHLDTVQLPTVTHSDRCLEIFYCSSAVNGSCPIERHPYNGTILKEMLCK